MELQWPIRAIRALGVVALLSVLLSGCSLSFEATTVGSAMRDVCTGSLEEVQTALEFLRTQDDNAAKGFLMAWSRALDGDEAAMAAVKDICSSFL